MSEDLNDLTSAHRRQYELIMALGGIRGGAEDDPDPDDDPDDDPDPDEDKVKNPHGLSEAQQRAFNRLGAKEKREGKKAGQAELMEALGITDPEELKTIVAKHKTSEQEQQGDLQKAETKRQTAEREAAEAKTALANERHERKVDLALLDAGVKPKAVARVRGMLNELEVGAEDEDVEEAIENLKEDFPELFPTEDDAENDDSENDRRERERNGPPHSDPGRRPKRKPEGKSGKEKALSRVHERHPHTATQ